jgi:hypothetical protein
MWRMWRTSAKMRRLSEPPSGAALLAGELSHDQQRVLQEMGLGSGITQASKTIPRKLPRSRGSPDTNADHYRRRGNSAPRSTTA